MFQIFGKMTRHPVSLWECLENQKKNELLHPLLCHISENLLFNDRQWIVIEGICTS